MSPRLGFLGAECRAKAVNLSQCCRRGFTVQLSGLGKIGCAFVEILGGEESAALADRSGENRGVHEDEVALVEKIPDRLLHFVPNMRYSPLSWCSQPEVTVVEQKVDPVLFRLDRIIDWALAIDGQIRDAKLESARRTGIGANFALDFDRCLLGELAKS